MAQTQRKTAESDGSTDEGEITIEQYAARLRSQMARILEVQGEITDQGVLRALKDVPRHTFLPTGSLYRLLYDPRQVVQVAPELGVSLSEPYLMAQMLQELQVKPGQRVLEVGTGMGYNAALLANIVGPTGSVVTVEVQPEVAPIAQDNLVRLGITNVTVIHGDGHEGYMPNAPYDRIIATAAATHLPPALYEQLDPEGRMVIPLGLPDQPQGLFLEQKGHAPLITSLGSVGFHPMVSPEALSPIEV